MPQFIETLNDPQMPAPYDLRGVDIYSFEIKADMAKLKLLCDRVLNIGSLQDRGSEYRPLLPFAALEILSYQRMSCIDPPNSGYGYITQQELYFRCVVGKYKLIRVAGIDFLILAEVRNFFPFIFVDNTWSAFTGREVIGMAKQLGTIAQATTAGGSYSAALSLPVLAVYSPNTGQTSPQVVTVQTGNTAVPVPFVRGWPYALLDFGNLLGGDAQLLQHIEMLLDPNLMSTIQLKQIRDAQVATDACFQGLVSGDFLVSSPTVPDFFDPDDVVIDVPRFASLTIADTLGFASTGPLQPVIAYKVSANMRYVNVRNEFVLM